MCLCNYEYNITACSGVQHTTRMRLSPGGYPEHTDVKSMQQTQIYNSVKPRSSGSLNVYIYN